MVELTPALAAYLAGVFLLAGLVKGVAGFGLPLITVPLASMVAPVPTAIAWSLLSVISANVVQAVECRGSYRVLATIWPLLAGLAVALVVTMQMLAVVDSAALSVILGVLIQVFVLSQLKGAPPVTTARRGRGLRLTLSGTVSGALGGLTSFYGFPALQSLLSLGLGRGEFIFATSVFFLTGSLILGAGLQALGILTGRDLAISFACLIPTLVGTRLGAVVRNKLSVTVFRRVVLAVLSATGLAMILRAMN